jgi:hypothetical protein
MTQLAKNFKTHNDNIDWEGGSLQGYIDASYKDLKKVFGNPSEDFDNYKCDAEWNVKFDDGTYATIYNYKDGKNYCGKDGIPKTKIRDWHIGGNGGQKAINLIEQAIKNFA